MIGWLSGKLVDSSENRLTLAVGGVGYSVLVAQRPDHPALIPGEGLELWVHTHVREDALELFGFRSALEKELFLTVTQVQGVGPKLGIAMLSNVTPEHLVECVLSEDSKALTEIPGIGKKMAERLILELRDPMDKKVKAGALRRSSAVVARASAVKSDARGTGASSANLELPPVVREALQALVHLGFREGDARSTIERAFLDLQDSGFPAPSVEDLVRRSLSRGARA